MYYRSYPRAAAYRAPRAPRQPVTQTADTEAKLVALGAVVGQLSGKGREIALDLISKSGRYLLSEKQVALVVRLTEQVTNPQPRPTETLASPAAPIFALFTTAAASGLKHPKVTLTATDGTAVVFKRAGQQSKYQGQVQITDDRPFGQNKYFGRIDEQGTLTLGRDMTEPVRNLIDAFAADPATVAAEYGKRTGACCFCSRALDTTESVAVGYGPVCAKKYNLPWGK